VIFFLLPIVLAVFVGIDIFSNKAIYEVGHSFGWIVTGWVAYCLLSVFIFMVLLGISMEKNPSLPSFEDFSNSKTNLDEIKLKKIDSPVVFAISIFLIISCINLGVYINRGFDEVDILNQKIVLMPTEEEINFSEYENQIEEAYALYSTFDFWQKSMLKNEDHLLNVVAGFNQHKVNTVKSAMELISLESVSKGDILTNAIELYADLNDEQRALLISEEIHQYDNFVIVGDVVKRLYEINNDVFEQYKNLENVLDIYQTIDDNYKAYVYNYDLATKLKERYEYLNQFLFESVDGGYSIRPKEGVKIQGELIIPDSFKDLPVVSIPDEAFKDNSEITEIVVPNSIQSIGCGAFKGCNSLEEITLPFVGKNRDALYYEAVFGYVFGYEQKDEYPGYQLSNTFKNIDYHGAPEGATWQYSCKRETFGNSSFYYYIPSSLREVTITDQAEIKTAAFNGCKNIECVTYEQEIEMISEAAFQNCESLLSFNSKVIGQINLHGQCKSIEQNAFKNCVRINDLLIPDGIVRIESYAFEGLGITTLIIPSSVDAISVAAFYRCNSLEEITLPFAGRSMNASAYEAVFGYIFGYIQKNAGDIYKHYQTTAFINAVYGSSDGVWQYTCYVSGHKNSFYYYIPSSLKTVTITQQTNVPVAAFNGCSMLTDIIFTKGIESQGECAFQNCSATVN